MDTEPPPLDSVEHVEILSDDVEMSEACAAAVPGGSLADNAKGARNQNGTHRC